MQGLAALISSAAFELCCSLYCAVTLLCTLEVTTGISVTLSAATAHSAVATWRACYSRRSRCVSDYSTYLIKYRTIPQKYAGIVLNTVGPRCTILVLYCSIFAVCTREEKH